jgi:hypothetical protein
MVVVVGELFFGISTCVSENRTTTKTKKRSTTMGR